MNLEINIGSDDLKNLIIERAAGMSLAAANAPKDLGKQIVICDRSFIYVGDVMDYGDHLIISSALNIRYWGTTKGVGQLRTGPTSTTKLDDYGTVRVPSRAVIGIITVEGGTWKATS